MQYVEPQLKDDLFTWSEMDKFPYITSPLYAFVNGKVRLLLAFVEKYLKKGEELQ